MRWTFLRTFLHKRTLVVTRFTSHKVVNYQAAFLHVISLDEQNFNNNCQEKSLKYLKVHVENYCRRDEISSSHSLCLHLPGLETILLLINPRKSNYVRWSEFSAFLSAASELISVCARGCNYKSKLDANQIKTQMLTQSGRAAAVKVNFAFDVSCRHKVIISKVHSVYRGAQASDTKLMAVNSPDTAE